MPVPGGIENEGVLVADRVATGGSHHLTEKYGAECATLQCLFLYILNGSSSLTPKQVLRYV